jgi:hypothetical protein
VQALNVIGASELTAETVADTLGAIVKDHDDLELVQEHLDGITSGD